MTRRRPLRPAEADALRAAVLCLGPFALTPFARPFLAAAVAAGAALADFLED